MRTIEQIEALVRNGRLGIAEAIDYVIENNLEENLPKIEDYCVVKSSGRSQNVNYGDFTSSGEIIDWSYERRNFYKKAKENEDGELEVKIYHSDFINWNGLNFEIINLYDTLKYSDL